MTKQKLMIMIKKINELEVGDKIILKENWRTPCNTVVNGHHYVVELCPVEVPSIVTSFRKIEGIIVDEKRGLNLGALSLSLYSIDTGRFHELNKRVEDFDKTESSDILMVEESTKNKRRIIKPFNLNAAKNGARIETKRGERVHIINWDGEGDYPLKAIVCPRTKEENDHRIFVTYTLDGKYDKDCEKYQYMDLIIVEYEDIESE